MAIDTFPRTPQSSIFDRAVDLSRINWEIISYVLLITASIVAHLWGLGAMAMHHDESIHAWMSWKFYTGNGGFTCYGGVQFNTYCYDPVYHGPSLYMLTLLSYLLFGAGDVQARLPMAIAGIGLVASCWWLRPYLGRRGALIAAVLLGFSPTLLYFTRFARHDGLMVLWELWIFIGLFRYLDTGKPGFLYLLAASLALAIGTHELYYILFFIFGVLFITRLIAETTWVQYLNAGFAIVLALAGIFIILNPPLPVGEGLYLGEKMALVATTVLLTWLASRVWSPQPVLLPRLRALVTTDLATFLIALGLFVGLYLVQYTTFFAYPAGVFGPIYGLQYWLGSQQEFARGDQPWYYYLMQLGIYEPLSIVCGLGAAFYLFSRPATNRLSKEENVDELAAEAEARDPSASPASTSDAADQNGNEAPAGEAVATTTLSETAPPFQPEPQSQTSSVQTTADPLMQVLTGNLVPLVLAVWYLSAIVIFSWAGEKMPWLTVHMSLPGNLLAAWVLGRLLALIPSFRQEQTAPITAEADGKDAGEPAPTSDSSRNGLIWRVVLVPLLFLAMLITLGVALSRLRSDTSGLEGQMNLLQGLVPLVIAGVLLYLLLSIGQQIGWRVLGAVTALTVAVLLGGYMVRATWLAVYTHPDVPIELLVYTQTSPDVPRYMERVHELAINQTRNHRTESDETGELGMPVVVSGGQHSLAWPLQWYLRDYQQLIWKDDNQMESASLATFETTLPDGSSGLAPVLLLASPHVTPALRDELSTSYVRPYGEQGVFNWWFPEGNKCDPASPGYKRFYFDTFTSHDNIAEPPPDGCIAVGVTPEQMDQQLADLGQKIYPPWEPLIFPFRPENWDNMRNFLLFRELPDPLVPGSRDMEVWVRSDLVGGGGTLSDGPAASTAPETLRLLAEQQIGSGNELNGPTGITMDAEGNIYVADTQNHRIQIFAEDGTLEQTIGSYGAGENQFNEPRGVAVDSDGNIYVADTWNARIVKLSPSGDWITSWGTGQPMAEGDPRLATITGATREGNAANPLGFFGPRGVVVDSDGNILIADTGNRRIVVTDDEGEYLYQWGSAGNDPGQFNEPTSLAVDTAGNLYVADTWNGRVQVFPRNNQSGIISDLPMANWRIRGWAADTYEDPTLTVSPDGSQVFVSIPTRQTVLATDSFGQPLLSWGGAGGDLASLNSPSGLAIGADGQVYVVDRNANRVLRFGLPQVLPNQLGEPVQPAEAD